MVTACCELELDSLGGFCPFKSLTMDTVLSQSNKKRALLLFIALLVAAGLVGFGLGAALWEGGLPLPQDYYTSRL